MIAGLPCTYIFRCKRHKDRLGRSSLDLWAITVVNPGSVHASEEEPTILLAHCTPGTSSFYEKRTYEFSLPLFTPCVPNFSCSSSPYLSLQNHWGLIPSTNPTLSHGFMSNLKILLLMDRLCIPPIRTRYSPRIQLPVQRRMRPLVWRQRNDRVLKRPSIVL